MSDRLPLFALAKKVRAAPVKGSPGQLLTLPIASLRINPAYQREITSVSASNIAQIVSDFDWAKFLPAIVVASEDGTYDLIDGQHRCTAALTRGFTEVPCYVLACSLLEAAAAFAAINGNVTPIGEVDMWRALVAAGDPEAVTLAEVLADADVKVVRLRAGFGPGETRAVKVLQRALRVYGRDLLKLTLLCIRDCGNGNPGMINGAVVNGIAVALKSKPDLTGDPDWLFKVFDRIDLAKILKAARIEAATTGNPAQYIMTRELNRLLSIVRRVDRAA